MWKQPLRNWRSSVVFKCCKPASNVSNLHIITTNRDLALCRFSSEGSIDGKSLCQVIGSLCYNCRQVFTKIFITCGFFEIHFGLHSFLFNFVCCSGKPSRKIPVNVECEKSQFNIVTMKCQVLRRREIYLCEPCILKFPQC